MARLRRDLSRYGPLLLMAAPGLILLFVFAYLPLPGLILAFKDYNFRQGILGSTWVGMRNFAFLFNSGTAVTIIRNTLLLNVLFIVSTQLAALVAALLIHEVYDHFVTRVYQSILFFPYFISFVLVGYFTFALLNSETGFVNATLTAFGGSSIDWYASPQFWPYILTAVNLWRDVGYLTIIYVAGIIGIHPEYFEAARIDGANRWGEAWYITLPLIRPLIIITVLLAIGRIFFANFDLIYNVTRDTGLLYPTTDVIDTYVFRSLKTLGNFNLASAAGLFQATVGFLLVLASNWLVRRVDSDQALF
ncbi:MAG: sugar ABC transporter permease [Chloroflexi bacterium]|nr:sugar ABC transporter permease [Chloroflexota bacterium]